MYHRQRPRRSTNTTHTRPVEYRVTTQALRGDGSDTSTKENKKVEERKKGRRKPQPKDIIELQKPEKKREGGWGWESHLELKRRSKSIASQKTRPRSHYRRVPYLERQGNTISEKESKKESERRNKAESVYVCIYMCARRPHIARHRQTDDMPHRGKEKEPGRNRRRQRPTTTAATAT